MQKSIIAGSLAVLASAGSIPHQQGKHIQTELRAKMKAQMKSLQTAGDIAPVVTNVVSALRGKKHKKEKFFQISFGRENCDEVSYTFGYAADVCLDYVDVDGDGYGLTRSHHFLVGDGFPVYEAFFGHGCKGSPAATQVIAAEEIGFASDYDIDASACVDMGGYYGKVEYLKEKHEPNYNAIMGGYGVSSKDCLKGELLEYEIERVIACSDNDEGEYYNYDLSNCASGQVTENIYSDDKCVTVSGSTVHKNQDCSFDLMEFTEGLEAEGTGYFYYAHTGCHVEGA